MKKESYVLVYHYDATQYVNLSYHLYNKSNPAQFMITGGMRIGNSSEEDIQCTVCDCHNISIDDITDSIRL